MTSFSITTTLQVADPLTQLFCKMLEYTPREDASADSLSHDDRLAWLEILLSITHTYHSLVSQDIPEFFEDNLRPWMEGFLALLRLTLPGVDAITDDCEANSLDRLKHAICDIATLFSQRYEECFTDYTEGFIAGTWKLLTMTDQRSRLVLL
jgi:exportin-2 (importin alpha re-exporter)